MMKKTEFLLCKPLEITTTTRNIFKVVSNFFEEHGIEWKNLRAVCTDGAPAMLGCRSGFEAFPLGEFLISTLLHFQFLI
jgi:hypothetical protein